MTRVIHTGDTHVGYRQYHSPERREDFLDAFRRVVGDATEEGVDAVVHAGDLFHDRRPELPDLLGTLSALRELDDAGVPFLAVVGNHESARGGQWLDLFESMGLATRLGDEPVVVGETAFYGLDHVPASRRDALDYEFAPHDAAHAALVGHGLFEPFAHGEWDTERVLESATVEFDAMLLGDNHTPDTAEVCGTWVTYCGSTERASASERDGRGYNLVTFDGSVDIRRRALDTRPFVFVDADLGPGEGVERVRDRVRERDVSDAVVIVEVTGEGDPVAPAAVEEFAVERGALIARVTDRREVESESDVSVSFADPDEAVRERVADLGLSPVARDVDGIVRGETADSNVRGEVKRRLDERLDDPESFLAATGRADAEDDAVPDEPDDGGTTAAPNGPDRDAASGGNETDASADGTGTSAVDGGETDDAEGTGAGDADDASAGDADDAGASDVRGNDRGSDGADGQATMGEYR